MPRTPKHNPGVFPGASLGIGEGFEHAQQAEETTALAPTKCQRGGNRREKRCTIRRTLKLSERHDDMLRQLAAWLDVPAAEVLKRALLTMYTDAAPHHAGRPANAQGARNADAQDGSSQTEEGATTTVQAGERTTKRRTDGHTSGTDQTPKARGAKPAEAGKRPRARPGRPSPEHREAAQSEHAGSPSWPAHAQPQPIAARSTSTAPSFGHTALDTKQAAPVSPGVSALRSRGSQAVG